MHKLESRFLGEISITSDMQMTLPYGRKQRGTKEPLEESEREEWKSWPKTTFIWVYLWLTKVHIVKAMIFPIVMYRSENWTIKKAECQRIDAFKPWCWRRLLRVPWTGRRSNQSILKEINPEYSLEGLMLKPKLQYFGHLIRRIRVTGKWPWWWERLKAGGEGSDREWDGCIHHWHQ